MMNKESIKKNSQMISAFAKKHRKIILRTCLVLVFFIIFSWGKYLFETKSVYYLNKDQGTVFSERINVDIIGIESDIQSFLRSYLAGSQDYKAKIPFTYETRLISASHDKDEKTLILNWNSYFYRALEQKNVDKDIEVLLNSLEKNFSIDKVYFLVEGSKLAVDWKNKSLGDGITLNETN